MNEEAFGEPIPDPDDQRVKEMYDEIRGFLVKSYTHLNHLNSFKKLRRQELSLTKTKIQEALLWFGIAEDLENNRIPDSVHNPN